MNFKQVGINLLVMAGVYTIAYLCSYAWGKKYIEKKNNNDKTKNK